MTNDRLDFILQVSSATRKNIQKLSEGFSIEQLNKIPDGFNNNIVWNFMHIITTQQLLCYGLSGLKPTIDSELIANYRKGTAPGNFITADVLEEWYALGQSTLETLRKDYQNGIFKTYKTYPTSYNIALTSIEDALQFNIAHEALHLGTVFALRKLI